MAKKKKEEIHFTGKKARRQGIHFTGKKARRQKKLSHLDEIYKANEDLGIPIGFTPRKHDKSKPRKRKIGPRKPPTAKQKAYREFFAKYRKGNKYSPKQIGALWKKGYGMKPSRRREPSPEL